MKLVKKITLSDCGIDMKAALLTAIMPAAVTGKDDKGNVTMADTGPGVPLLRIMGVVNGAKPGTRTMPDGKVSEWLTFKGQFEATNLLTGEVYQSGTCIMPGALPDLLFGAIKGADDDFKTAQFAVEIGAHYDKSAITSYVYDTKTLLEPKESDAMAALKALIAPATAPAIAAPAAVPAAAQPQVKPDQWSGEWQGNGSLVAING